jgi:hypothetical protein
MAKRNNIMMTQLYPQTSFSKAGQIPYFNDGCGVINVILPALNPKWRDFFV